MACSRLLSTVESSVGFGKTNAPDDRLSVMMHAIRRKRVFLGNDHFGGSVIIAVHQPWPSDLR